MNNYILLSGDFAQMSELPEIEGYSIESRYSREIGGGMFEVDAEASNDSITALEAAGYAVTVLKTADEITTHLLALEQYIGVDDDLGIV